MYSYVAEAQQRQPIPSTATSLDRELFFVLAASHSRPRRRRLTAATLALTAATKLPAATLASTASVLAAVPSR